jgi:hypothetical protein
MADNLMRLSLEVDPRSDPIRGAFDDDDGDRQPFEGWMELAAVLQGYCDRRVAVDEGRHAY